MKKVLITGSGSGLGKYLRDRFLAKGHNVFLHNGKLHFDLRNADDILQLANECIDAKVTVIINNAGILCPNVTLDCCSVELINDMIDVNLRAPILLTYYMLPYLTNIININSIVGLKTKKYRTLYSATKWGLRGFSNSLRKELKNVKILDVYPTGIKTENTKYGMSAEEVANKIYDAFVQGKEELILGSMSKKLNNKDY